jgi:hypothetical protein
MTTAARREVVALAVVTAAAGALSASFPRLVALADLLLWGAVFLLLQGLVRDLGRLRRERTMAAMALRLPVHCVCVESTLGVGAIVAGSLLLLAWTPIVLAVSRIVWPAAIAGLGAFGFLTRHLVFDWKARRLRRDPEQPGPVGTRS